MKKILFLFFILLTFGSVYALELDFSKSGNEKSNEILKDYISAKMPNFKGNVVSYFYDMDNDNKQEVFGIVKSNLFYGLAGYKLIVLKETESVWTPIQNDVYFDLGQKFEIKKDRIIYHYSVLYKNKKFKAKIKENKIYTKKGLIDLAKDKKVHDIEEITKFVEHKERNDFRLEQFNSHGQGEVTLEYKNLSPKTKHYIELK